MDTSEIEPHYGHRLMPLLVDELAVSKPANVYASIIHGNDVSAGFDDITWSRFANAVNRMAWWLESTLGDRGPHSPTVGYLGPADIRYFILVLAANKAGFKLLLPSPRNTVEATVHLMEETKCQCLLKSHSSHAEEVLQQRSLETFEVPSLKDMLAHQQVEHYPFTKDFKSGKDDPYVILHSSGSTGLPKPITSPHSVICTPDAYQNVPPLDGRENSWSGFLSQKCRRFWPALPFYHCAGLLLSLAAPLYFGISAVFGPADQPVSAHMFDELVDHGNLTGIFCPPFLLEEITKNPSSLERLSKLEGVIAGVGPLSSAAGELISEKTFLALWSGSTEAHTLLQHTPDPEDWKYFVINSDGSGIEWRLYDKDEGLYEMVYIRDDALEDIQGIFKTFPQINVYATGDLYQKHPTKPHRWRATGRIDDILILTNGEKVAARPVEDTLIGHRYVQDALLVGQGKPRPALIIEPSASALNDMSRERLLNEIWPHILKINEHLPSFGRLSKPYTMLSTPQKPFVRVGKGTTSRSATLELYGSEIEQMYQRAETAVVDMCQQLDFDSAENFSETLQDICGHILGTPIETRTQDLFDTGMDSLHALTLSASLQRQFEHVSSKANVVNSALIYANPSVDKLSTTLLKLGDRQGNFSSTIMESDTPGELLNSHLRASNTPNTSSKISLMVTGTTGQLGSYILRYLLQQDWVSRVYCLNRDPYAKQRQMKMPSFLKLGNYTRKAVFLHSDLDKLYLGLNRTTYWELIESVNGVVHCQWMLDINRPVNAFKPLLNGVSRLAQFCRQTVNCASLTFTSSLAVALNWTRDHANPVLESTLTEFTLCKSGYGQSKLAAELILEHAARRWGVSSSVVRIGQIAGSSEHDDQGVWPKQEWLPSLIASSLHLGQIPKTLGPGNLIDWLPIDVVAASICDIVKSKAESTPPFIVSYYHIVNPAATKWQDLLPDITASFQADIQPVPLHSWCRKLEASRGETGNTAVNPAIKILSFFQDLAEDSSANREWPRLDTTYAMRVSPRLAQTGPIRSSWLLHWLQQWDFESKERPNS